MAKHLEREIDNLQKKVLSLATLVEEQVTTAVSAVEKKNVDAAARVIQFDRHIDLLEIEVEEDCLKMLALHQPVAVDLRFIVAILKINSDLERIADLAANIADRAILLAKSEFNLFDDKLTVMRDKAVLMLRQCLDALFKMDTEIARSVCVADEEVDIINREMVEIVKTGIADNSNMVPEYLLLLSISKNLERIADHATNIAEDVIYLIEGDIVRHHEEKLRKSVQNKSL